LAKLCVAGEAHPQEIAADAGIPAEYVKDGGVVPPKS